MGTTRRRQPRAASPRARGSRTTDSEHNPQVEGAPPPRRCGPSGASTKGRRIPGGGGSHADAKHSGGLLVVLLGIGLLLLSGCSTTDTKTAVSGEPELPDIPDAVPEVEPKSKYGNPKSYVVFGRRYYTKASSRGHVERGLASWYGKQFHGRRTSSGERYDMYAMTAAHKTLPLPTYARVTNITNGRSAVVKINDRGPFHGTRIIDLSYSAARKLGVVAKGTAMVEVRAIDPTIDPSRPGAETKNLFLAAENRAGGEKKQASRKAAATREPPPATASDSGGDSAPRIAHASAADGARHGPPATKPATKAPVENRLAAPAVAPPEPQAVVAASGGETPAVAVAARDPAATAAGLEPSPQPGTPPSPRQSSSPSTYLQVGAFGSRRNAEKLRRQLSAHIAEQVQVLTVHDQAASLYKVHVGPLASKKSASDLSVKLASLGLKGSPIVVEQPPRDGEIAKPPAADG